KRLTSSVETWALRKKRGRNSNHRNYNNRIIWMRLLFHSRGDLHPDPRALPALNGRNRFPSYCGPLRQTTSPLAVSPMRDDHLLSAVSRCRCDQLRQRAAPRGRCKGLRLSSESWRAAVGYNARLDRAPGSAQHVGLCLPSGPVESGLASTDCQTTLPPCS